MKLKGIPEIDSVKELAHFWDTHDLTDFEADLQEETEPIFRQEDSIRIHLPQSKLEIIKAIAKSIQGDAHDSMRLYHCATIARVGRLSLLPFSPPGL